MEGQRKTAGENSCGFYFLSCIGIKLPYNYALFFSEAIFSTSSMVSSVYAASHKKENFKRTSSSQ